MKDVSLVPTPSVGNTHVRELKLRRGGTASCFSPEQNPLCARGAVPCLARRNAFLLCHKPWQPSSRFPYSVMPI